MTVAVWPIWLPVLRPGVFPARRAGPALTRRVKRIAAGGVGLALLGSVLALLVQTESFNGGDGYLADLTAASPPPSSPATRRPTSAARTAWSSRDNNPSKSSPWSSSVRATAG